MRWEGVCRECCSIVAKYLAVSSIIHINSLVSHILPKNQSTKPELHPCSSVPSHIPKSPETNALIIYKTTCLASFIKLSLGQYGHLNLPPLLSFPRLSRATTCPHGIIIGGFASVVCSLLTGQTKIAWKMKLLGRAISTGNSFWVVHSVRFSFCMVASFSRVGRAIAPAVVAR